MFCTHQARTKSDKQYSGQKGMLAINAADILSAL